MSEARRIFCDDCKYSGPPAAADENGVAQWGYSGNGFFGHSMAIMTPHQAHCPKCGRKFDFTVTPEPEQKVLEG